MALKRVIPIPLDRRPEILWGLSFEDLPWLVVALIVDVFLWHRIHASLIVRMACLAIPSIPAGCLAWFRLEERTVPEWLWLWFRYQIRPKQYWRK